MNDYDTAIFSAAAIADPRLAIVLADRRIQGRERAAINFARAAPSMSAKDIADWVATNVPAGKPIAGLAVECATQHEKVNRFGLISSRR